MRIVTGCRAPGVLVSLGCLALAAGPATAGGPHARARRVRALVPTAAVAPATVAPMQTSGFFPTPVALIRGSGNAGGGYTPLGQYGPYSMSYFGPFSSFRATAAPVVVYARGYDGVYRPTVARTFSTPNLPAASPVVYPTQSTHVDGPRRPIFFPAHDAAINWLDQN
ncbi:MAG TPA: hypothetical protein VG406_15895 [Isosphaeraceae bacterium]|jgi:hypothetical protein|nr:hypothetical protein [Isosphaeraceae bacterium]